MVDTNAASSSQNEGKTYLNVGGCHSNDQGGSDCGYCKDKPEKLPKGHNSWGITSSKTTVSDY